MLDPPYTLFSLAIAAFVAKRGASKKSLSTAGAFTAFLIGFINFLAGPQFGFTLLAFFFSSSRLTKFKGSVKARLEADHLEGGQRRSSQVLANSLGGTVCAVAAWLKAAGWQPLEHVPAAALTGGFVGHYACCCADTWASEVGILSSEVPRLVTSFKPVPRGTNGGVTYLGTLCGLAGGLFMGMSYWGLGLLSNITSSSIPSISACLTLGAAGGMLGNFIDSLLGATLQYSGYSSTKQCIVQCAESPDVMHISGRAVLSNSQVNFVSALLASLMTAGLAVAL